MIYIENKKTSHILQQEHMNFGSLNYKHDFLHFRCCYNDCVDLSCILKQKIQSLHIYG